jgi:geranylgeranyl reductase family protein
MDWPDLASFPNYGLTRTRMDFDQTLANAASGAGATLLTGTNVLGPSFDDDGRAVGVKTADRTFTAPIVVAADGVSGRFPLALGLRKKENRPLGVAVRRYYRSPRHLDDYLESWLELRGKDGGTLLPGYGWLFGMGDGRVNVGLGVLNSSVDFGRTNYRHMLTEWMEATPEEWGLREANADGPIQGAALPMGFNRVPHYTRGVMLVGDSGGMVNPFNGEGIAYAMESGALAAEVAVSALAAKDAVRREHALQRYPAELSARFGGYYRLGGWFVKLIGRPEVMRFATKHGLPHPTLMRFVLKLMANLTDQRGGDAMDRVINALTRVVPAV